MRDTLFHDTGATRAFCVGAILLCVAAIGCGHTSGGAYNQGVPVTPRAPVFSPAQDAPHTIGMPGTQPRRVSVEPNPKPTRVLPQTPETMRQPGIWASETPEFPHDSPNLRLLGFVMPAPDDIGTMDDLHAPMLCASPMDVATRAVDSGGLIGSLSPRERACLAAQLFTACLAQLGKGLEIAKAKGAGHDDRLLAHVRAAYQVAIAHRDAVCGADYRTPPDHDALIVAAWRMWNNMTNKGGGK
jgi:hypothetical protein